MKKLLFTLLMRVFIVGSVAAQANEYYISGPMLGYVEHREALIWLEVKATCERVEVVYYPVGKPENKQTVAADMSQYLPVRNARSVPVKVVLGPLDMGTEYEYEVWLNGKKLHTGFATRLKTKVLWEWRMPAPDASFLIGSCQYINDAPYDRPGRPYGTSPDTIYASMLRTNSDFMVWGGDNVYLREADYSSVSGMKYRYSYNFSYPAMQALRASRPNVAIWDDHDFGPNDSDASFASGEASLALFKSYWGNQHFGEADNPGVYSAVRYSDMDLFLMDNRYHRSPDNVRDSIGGKPNPDKVYYGQKQLTWLKNQLQKSDAVFKIIVTGGQTLNPICEQETMYDYSAEWLDLMQFIGRNNINGVVFVTGDRHHAELIKLKPANCSYAMYDFTTSPISSGVHTNLGNETNNLYRVPGTLVTEHNFGRVSVKGEKGSRTLTFELFDKYGIKKWEHSVPQSELQSK